MFIMRKKSTIHTKSGHCFNKSLLFTVTTHQLTNWVQASHNNQYASHYTIGAAHYTSRLYNINSLSPDNDDSFPDPVFSLPGTAWAQWWEGGLTQHFSHTAVPLCPRLASHSATQNLHTTSQSQLFVVLAQKQGGFLIYYQPPMISTITVTKTITKPAIST